MRAVGLESELGPLDICHLDVSETGFDSSRVHSKSEIHKDNLMCDKLIIPRKLFHLPMLEVELTEGEAQL